MATLDPESGKLQEFASIAIPGEWIEDDDGLDPATCKIGGHTNLFELWHASLEDVACPSCKKKMYLLTQINAPLVDEMTQRNVYVFMCCNNHCSKTSAGWKVMVCRGPTVAHFPKPQKRKEEQPDTPEIHKMIKFNNKITANGIMNRSISQQLMKGDSFWNHGIVDAVESKPRNGFLSNHSIIDSSHDEKEQEMKSKLDGLNDDFARLMAMQQSLLKEVDHQNQHQQSRKSKMQSTANSKQLKISKVSEESKESSNNDRFRKSNAIKDGFVPFELVFYDEKYYEQTKNEKVIVWKDRKIDLQQFMDPENTPDDVEEEKEQRTSSRSKSSKLSKGAKRTSRKNNHDDDDDDNEGGLLIDYLERISLDKRQCIRYCYGAEPLLPHKMATKKFKKIPECEGCGKKLVFEFQIMSNVLNSLKPKQIDHEWMTALVFVCPTTCKSVQFHHVVVCCEPK